MTSYATAKPVLATSNQDEIVQKPGGWVDFSISPELKCEYDGNSSVLWTTSTPRGIPCFSMDLLRAMERGSQIIEGYFSGSESVRPLSYIALRSGISRTFNVGGDLGLFLRLIANQDRARLTEYARTAIDVSYRNYTSHNIKGVTTVALLEGDALGGGFESALSCDLVIAEEHVKAGFPEVMFNMFPGMGGRSFLARRVGRNIAHEMSRTGRLYGARELLELGVVDRVVESRGAVSAFNDLMRNREHQREAHTAMNTIDRMLNPVTLSELHEVVRLWVDCAMRLSPRGQAWMRRLLQQQVANFGESAALRVVQGSTPTPSTEVR